MLATQQDIPNLEEIFAGLMDQANRDVANHDVDEIAIDCSAITTIRSSMLDRLIRLHLDARQYGARVVLENVNDLVLEVIALTRLDRMLQIRIDEGHAIPPRSHPPARVRWSWGKRSGNRG